MLCIIWIIWFVCACAVNYLKQLCLSDLLLSTKHPIFESCCLTEQYQNVSVKTFIYLFSLCSLVILHNSFHVHILFFLNSFMLSVSMYFLRMTLHKMHLWHILSTVFQNSLHRALLKHRSLNTAIKKTSHYESFAFSHWTEQWLHNTTSMWDFRWHTDVLKAKEV